MRVEVPFIRIAKVGFGCDKATWDVERSHRVQFRATQNVYHPLAGIEQGFRQLLVDRSKRIGRDASPRQSIIIVMDQDEAQALVISPVSAIPINPAVIVWGDPEDVFSF
jgi:hypothetical protein